jgi:hypothetical protein
MARDCNGPANTRYLQQYQMDVTVGGHVSQPFERCHARRGLTSSAIRPERLLLSAVTLSANAVMAESRYHILSNTPVLSEH